MRNERAAEAAQRRAEHHFTTVVSQLEEGVVVIGRDGRIVRSGDASLAKQIETEGYDPLLQFIHESDLARAIRLCIDSPRSGVYNVGGEGVISYKKAVALAGARAIPLPSLMVYGALGTLSRPPIAARPPEITTN